MKERKTVQIVCVNVPNERGPNGEGISQGWREQWAVADDGTLWCRGAAFGHCFGGWQEDYSLPPREDESEKEEG